MCKDKSEIGKEEEDPTEGENEESAEAEDESSTSWLKWLLVVGVPAACAAAIGIGICMARTGKCSCCCKCFKALCCARDDESDGESRTPEAPMGESTPHKTTNHLNVTTNNLPVGEGSGAEGAANERKSAASSKHSLDHSTVRLDLLKSSSGEDMRLKSMVSSARVGVCEACNTPNANLLAVFSCGHNSLCDKCSGSAKSCPSCENENRASNF